MISIIVPATKEDDIRRLYDSLTEVDISFELIPIFGASSFFDAWKKGLETATGDIVMLTHQDTLFHHFPDLDEALKEFDLIGVAGCRNYNTKDPWWFSSERLRRGDLSGMIYHDAPDSKGLSVFGRCGQVDIIDGVCMITKRKVFEKILKGINVDVTWDWYDHVLSSAYRKAGLKVGTIPLLMTHMSAGGERRPSFYTQQENFIAYEKDNNKKP